MSRPIAIALALLATPVAAAASQDADSAPPRAVLLRIAAGALNPEDPFATTFAYAVSTGIEWGGRRAVLLRVARQNHERRFGVDPRSRTFITLDGEFARWTAGLREQQIRLRLGLGVLLRPGPDPTGLVASGGVAIRYEVVPRISFIGQLEDDFSHLPRKEYQVCYTGFSYVINGVVSRCDQTVTGGLWQHNFGLIVALEWRP